MLIKTRPRLGHPRLWLQLTEVHKAASATLIKALSNYRIVIVIDCGLSVSALSPPL